MTSATNSSMLHKQMIYQHGVVGNSHVICLQLQQNTQ